MSTEMDVVNKQEAPTESGVERTRNRKVYVPRVDISESKDAVVITAEMPGVDADSVEVKLEKDVLTLEGTVKWDDPENQELFYREFELGDYHRAFTLSEQIDQEHIEAKVSNGVLHLTLPKAEKAKPRQISIKAG